MENRKEIEETNEKALTCIHPSYTLCATDECGEIEEMMIRHFLNILAEVALSVVARKGDIR